MLWSKEESMIAEIEEFYFSRNLPIDRLIDIGISFHGLQRDYIERAIVKVFKEESDLQKHQIAWRIFALARATRSKDLMEMHIARLNTVTKPEEPRPFMEEELKASPVAVPPLLDLPDPSIVIGGTRRTLSERLFLFPAAAIVVFIAVVAYAYLGGLQ
jgi:hypothetical protein